MIAKKCKFKIQTQFPKLNKNHTPTQKCLASFDISQLLMYKELWALLAPTQLMEERLRSITVDSIPVLRKDRARQTTTSLV